jgi:Bax protein
MNPRDQFIQGITECTVLNNAFIPPTERVVVVISVAQAILESDWGRSRFAKQGNNFYGIIETDSSEPHMKSLNSKVMLKIYGNKCESVSDYIELLNTSSAFEEYRELRIRQYMSDNVDVFQIIETLENYAVDSEYTKKLLAVTLGLFEKYPKLFKSKEIWEYYNNNKNT